MLHNILNVEGQLKTDFALDELYFSGTKWEVVNLQDVEGDHRSTSGSESEVEKSCSQLEDGGSSDQEEG